MMRTICDCGCGAELGQYDAGKVPVILRAGGIELRVRVLEHDGRAPNLRPSCLGKMIAKAEQVWPPKPPKITDPEAAENEEDRANQPVPLRAEAGGAP